jgi:glycosyltransferase involved in cell wall biosynthesis
MSEQPLVSVVTPFYNTANYLGECIESVLAQNYTAYEYLLVDNQSTDGSAEIAAEYARRDPRIRLIRNEKFVGQVRNYNGALIHVAPKARYVKVVQADDYLFPECLERMVAVAESHPTAGIITSYYLEGRRVFGSGIEWPTECISGRTATRLHLLEHLYLFGSPTTVMYRADLLATRKPFYSESSMHEDTELCYDVLANADLGFVHQVLTFSRLGNEGVLTALDPFHWRQPLYYKLLRKYGPSFLSREEFAERIHAARSEYLKVLGESVLMGREAEFWEYHRGELATVGEQLPSTLTLAPRVAQAAVKAVARPKWFFQERTRLKHAHARRSQDDALASRGGA